MKKLGMVLALWFAVAPSALASLEFDAQGRVSPSGTYDGPWFDKEDVLAVLKNVVALSPAMIPLALTIDSPGLASTNLAGLIPSTIITWGASRTARYRAQFVKDQIHAELDAQRQQPKAGSVEELLQ